MKTMTLGRTFAGLASAAFIAAAMLFAPAPAQAHVGRDHAVATHTPHAETIASTSRHAENISAAVVSQIVTMAAPEAFTGAAKAPADEGNGTCPGGCCNGLGCCCGVGALWTAPPAEFPDATFHSAVFSFAPSSAAGIDPDALRRPPRTLV
jgi:hypothetical protein